MNALTEKPFFLVFARDRAHVFEKIEELENLGYQYKIVCGEQIAHQNVVYQQPKGKFAAINFGMTLVPKDVEFVAMNDVDTKIHNFNAVLNVLRDKSIALAFGTELVKEGPQSLFFRIFNPIRRIIPAAGSGELLVVRKSVLQKILPLKPCKAEATLILFSILQAGHRIVFCEDCYAETVRTKTPQKEELYKRKTVAGIYQAMNYSRPPVMVRVFYIMLPLASPLLLVIGKKGYYWMRGILLGLTDFLRGDRTGSWQTTYMD